MVLLVLFSGVLRKSKTVPQNTERGRSKTSFPVHLNALSRPICDLQLWEVPVANVVVRSRYSNDPFTCTRLSIVVEISFEDLLVLLRYLAKMISVERHVPPMECECVATFTFTHA